jgi:WD40 repeat protein
MAVSPDGRTLLTGSTDRTARLWDVSAGVPQGEPLTHDSPFVSVGWAPDGRTLLTINQGWDYSFWDAETRQRRGTPIHTKTFTAQGTFSPDGKQALLVGVNGKAVLADAATGRVVHDFPNPDMVRGLFFEPSGAAALTTTWGPRQKCSWQRWDVASGTMLGAFAISDTASLIALLSPQGDVLLTAGPTIGVQLWDVAAGKLRRTLPTTLHAGLAVFTPDGRRLLTAGSDRSVHAWDVPSGERLDWRLPHPEHVTGVTMSPDGHTVATTSGGSLRLWDFATAQPVGPVYPSAAGSATVLWSPDGARLFVRTPAQSVQVLPAPSAAPVDPERRRLWVEVTTGRRLDRDGRDHWLDAEEWQRRGERLQALGGVP